MQMANANERMLDKVAKSLTQNVLQVAVNEIQKEVGLKKQHMRDVAASVLATMVSDVLHEIERQDVLVMRSKMLTNGSLTRSKSSAKAAVIHQTKTDSPMLSKDVLLKTYVIKDYHKNAQYTPCHIKSPDPTAIVPTSKVKVRINGGDKVDRVVAGNQWQGVGFTVPKRRGSALACKEVLSTSEATVTVLLRLPEGLLVTLL